MHQLLLSLVVWSVLPLTVRAAPATPQCAPEKLDQTLEQNQRQLKEINGEVLAKPGVDCPKPDFAGGPPAKEPAKSSGEIRSVTRPVAVADGGQRNFDFKYGFHNRGKKKTIVMVKGGPTKDSWIDNTSSDEFKDYNLIVVEIPGAGHNKFDESVDFGNEVHVGAAAKLVKDIVAKEKLGEYVLAGHSYGTTVATAAASLITNEKDGRTPKPKALLLVGTVGRATKQKPGGHEVTTGAKDASDRAYAQLSAGERQRFKELLASANEEERNRIAGSFLGPISADSNAGLAFMKAILALPADQAMACINSSRRPPGGGAGEDPEMAYRQKFYLHAGCELSSGTYKMDTSHFFNGTLISQRPNSCYCSQAPHAGEFDSAKWPVRDIPIFYIGATDDLNTPPYQRQYHQTHQLTAASKTVFESAGGHGLGYSQFVTGGCGGAIEGIFADSPSRFRKEMSLCTVSQNSPELAPKPAPGGVR